MEHAKTTQLSFTTHHPKPLAVCTFGLQRRHHGYHRGHHGHHGHQQQPLHQRYLASSCCGSAASERKWDLLRTALRSTFQPKAPRLPLQVSISLSFTF